jgi:predicted DNA binding CopG/RHH family protein
MNARPTARPQLPAGLTPAEEARWWDEHREYWDVVETEDEAVMPASVHRTKPVNLRLPTDMIEQLKKAGAQRALPYQTLIRMWLKERLDAERPSPTA